MGMKFEYRRHNDVSPEFWCFKGRYSRAHHFRYNLLFTLYLCFIVPMEDIILLPFVQSGERV